MRPLILHLKREYWEAIQNGAKHTEYRRRSPYWTKRLVGQTFSEIILCWGYPSMAQRARRFSRKWNGMKETTIMHPLFGEGIVEVFAINVSEVI